jgi:hypothetical protein
MIHHQKILRAATMQHKYGVSNPSHILAAQQKRKNTFMANYGVDNPRKSPTIKDAIIRTKRDKYGEDLHIITSKIKKTNNDRYGMDWYMGTSDFFEKSISTLLDKYGVTNPSKSPSIVAKRLQTNMDRYGVPHYSMSNMWNNQVRDTCMKRYGVDHYSKTTSYKEGITSTHLSRYGRHFTQMHIPDDVLSQLNDSVWLIQQHHDLQKSVVDISNELGVSWSIVDNRLKIFSIKHKLYYTSAPEKSIVEFLQSCQNSPIILRDKTIIGKELDIFVPTYNLAIEVNGVFWHSELNGKFRTYHLHKTLLCNEKGLKLLHITDNQWYQQRPIVESIIKNAINHPTIIPIHARKCIINQVSKEDAVTFLQDNHIQGGIAAGTINLGLFYNGSLVYLLSLGKSRYNKRYQYELIRMGSLLNHRVRGGASRLWKHFVSIYKPNTVVSYMDKTYSNERNPVYTNMGFIFSHTAPPNYKYFKRSDTTRLWSRVQFQKHKLPAILPTYDHNETEWSNMQNNGYDRIWDCGNDCWVWRK